MVTVTKGEAEARMRIDEALDTTARAGAELLSFAASGLHREAAAAASLLRLLPPDDNEGKLLRARALVLAGLPESALRVYATMPWTARDAPVRATALRLLGRWDQAEQCLERSAPALRTLTATASALECAALALDRGEPVLGRTAQQWAHKALHEAEFGAAAGEGGEAGARAGTGTRAEVEARAGGGAKATLGVEAGAEPGAGTEARAEVEDRSGVEAGSEAEAGAKVGPEAEVEPTPRAGAHAGAEVGAWAGARARGRAEFETGADARADVGAGARACAGTRTEARSRAEVETRDEAGAEVEARAEGVAGAKARAESEAQAGAEAGACTRTEAGAEAGPEAEAGAGAKAWTGVDIVYARCLLAAAYAAVGRFGAALDAADAAAQVLDGLGEDALLRRLDAVYRLADALFYTGRRHEAERRLGEALVRARDAAQEHVAGRLELGLARARLAAEDLASAGRWAERAAESARRTGGVPLAVDAALCLAQVRLAANDTAGALDAAETAVRAARPLGGVWRGRAAARLREVRMVREHERPPAALSDMAEVSSVGPSLDALSGREAQVAVLVSEGCTNQQIAARLRLSPKTVETHLSRIFKKLGITSRAQVAHWVGLTAGPARDDGG